MLKNPFPHSVRSLYLFTHNCFNCARSDRGRELHHIFGRESSAAFNACPLCRFCHERVTNSQEERAKLFFKNIDFLLENNYQPQKEDFALIARHPFLIESREFHRIFGKPVDT